ncbi:MAG: hypothetical protein OXN27_04455 [Candidatus Poribacteria bacterium]|nr:hypothetical protein [Candidatus Poribacteria bacterium]
MKKKLLLTIPASGSRLLLQLLEANGFGWCHYADFKDKSIDHSKTCIFEHAYNESMAVLQGTNAKCIFLMRRDLLASVVSELISKGAVYDHQKIQNQYIYFMAEVTSTIEFLKTNTIEYKTIFYEDMLTTEDKKATISTIFSFWDIPIPDEICTETEIKKTYNEKNFLFYHQFFADLIRKCEGLPSQKETQTV